ncbi:MAG: nucleotide exchange factor GrpE [Candidatus Bipolaricaulota bacterium]
MTLERVPQEVSPELAAAAPETAPDARDAEVKSLVDRLQRLQAEFENYRKRMARDVAVLVERASDEEIVEFLPIYEHLGRALAAFASETDVDALTEGVRRVAALFEQLLERRGVRRMAAVGERFDPERHEAVLSVASDRESGVIVEEIAPGYARGERILVPCRVAVSRGPDPDKKEET